jgi:hypothetical protein
MQINWCLKGIAEGRSFGDNEAQGVLAETGILSSWLISNSRSTLANTNIASQNILSELALDDHVNWYGYVAHDTPYISLSAGCYEYRGRRHSPMRYPAFRTALDFATDGGRISGYIFRCWVITTLKPAPELPGVAEETRDLNLFSNMYRFHKEGEITAKLFVPRRQVQWVLKVGQDLRPIAASWTPAGVSPRAFRNSEFLWPDRVSNVVGAL